MIKDQHPWYFLDKEDSPILCKDCRYYHHYNKNDKPKCYHDKAIIVDITTGECKKKSCEDMRINTLERCGTQAKLFKLPPYGD